MNNQKDENEKIDLSQFPLGKKEPISESSKSFNVKNIQGSFAKMDKKNQLYLTIIVVCFVLTIIFLGFLLSKKSGIRGTITPEYAPPAEENI